MNILNKKDLSVSMAKANLLSLGFAIPMAVVFAWAYIIRWGNEQFTNGFGILFYGRGLPYFVAIFALGVVFHELIHGISWAFFGKKPLGVIKFGFQLKTFTPYAHCKEPLEVNAYRIGAFMPGAVLGILPALAGVINGNGWLMAFGIIFIIAAGGDMLILWLIRNVAADKLIEDHPTRAGCYVLDESR